MNFYNLEIKKNYREPRNAIIRGLAKTIFHDCSGCCLNYTEFKQAFEYANQMLLDDFLNKENVEVTVYGNGKKADKWEIDHSEDEPKHKLNGGIVRDAKVSRW